MLTDKRPALARSDLDQHETETWEKFSGLVR
jgi:hypothetical protein